MQIYNISPVAGRCRCAWRHDGRGRTCAHTFNGDNFAPVPAKPGGFVVWWWWCSGSVVPGFYKAPNRTTVVGGVRAIIVCVCTSN